MTLFVAALALFAGQVTRAVTGFGSALVALPVLVVVWSPSEAVGVLALLDLASGLLLLPPLRRHVIVPLLAVTVACLIPGQWLGTALLAVLPSDTIRMLLGVVLVPLALEILVRPVRVGRGEWTELPKRPAPILALGAVAGGAAGVLSGMLGAGGPPLVLFARRYFARDTFRAQVMATFFLGALPLTIMLWIRGLLPVETFERAGVMLPVVVVGAYSGHWLSGRLSAATFARVTGAVLAGAGLLLIFG